MAFAPITEEAGFGVGMLGALALCLFLILLRFGWSMSFSLILQTFAKLFDIGIPYPSVSRHGVGLSFVHPFHFVAETFRRLDNYVFALLGEGIYESQHAFNLMLTWNAYVLTKTGEAVANVAYNTLAALHLVRRDVSPAAIRRATAPAIAHATATLPAVKVKVDTRVPALQAEVAGLKTKVDTLSRALTVPSKVIVEKVETPAATTTPAVAIPAPVALPGVIPKIEDLERAKKWTLDQLGKLSKLGTVAGLVGVGAAVLGRLGLGWVKCSRVSRVGKQVCGMDTSLLDSLLADTLLIVGTLSLVEFAHEMQAVIGEADSLTRRFFRVA